jgi:hypothetical protein
VSVPAGSPGRHSGPELPKIAALLEQILAYRPGEIVQLACVVLDRDGQAAVVAAETHPLLIMALLAQGIDYTARCEFEAWEAARLWGRRCGRWRARMMRAGMTG